MLIYIWLVLYIGKTVPLIPASVTQDEATALSKFDYWEGTTNNKKNSNFLINNEVEFRCKLVIFHCYLRPLLIVWVKNNFVLEFLFII